MMECSVSGLLFGFGWAAAWYAKAPLWRRMAADAKGRSRMYREVMVLRV